MKIEKETIIKIELDESDIKKLNRYMENLIETVFENEDLDYEGVDYLKSFINQIN